VIHYLLDSSGLWRLLREERLRDAWLETTTLRAIGSCAAQYALAEKGALGAAGPLDLMICATAVHHGLVVLHDDADFVTVARFLPAVSERNVRNAPGLQFSSVPGRRGRARTPQLPSSSRTRHSHLRLLERCTARVATGDRLADQVSAVGLDRCLPCSGCGCCSAPCCPRGSATGPPACPRTRPSSCRTSSKCMPLAPTAGAP
jgi:hypothetical protein